MNWKIGQKLVCVKQLDNKGRMGFPNLPILGEIYTIRDIHPDGDAVRLNEIRNPDFPFIQGYHEGYFMIENFRPIVDIGDEVEQYIKSKITEPQYA